MTFKMRYHTTAVKLKCSTYTKINSLPTLYYLINICQIEFDSSYLFKSYARCSDSYVTPRICI